jgi:hypothetical protein
MSDEKLAVKFHPAPKLVVISNVEEGLHLKKFLGRAQKGEATVEVDDATTLDGIKEVIEEFRAM